MNANYNKQDFFEKLRTKARYFIVDTQNRAGEHWNGEATILNAEQCADAEIVGSIMKTYAAKGYEVCAIHELLHRYTSQEFEYAEKKEVRKHLRVLYVNPKALFPI